MTRIQIEQLIWDDVNREHIEKHTVTKEEVQEAIAHITAHRKGYLGRIALIGRSGKRILAVLVAPKKDKKYYVVTARDADKKERRLVYDNEKK